jgi:RNA polymerase sigma-70 factor (ECF subfamily)
VSTGASQSSESVRPREYFATTQWTVVFKAGSADSTNASLALEKICKVYWYPLYAHIRRRGYAPEDAKDLTQGFFERLLKQNSFAHADPQRGKFRSFILGALNHFLADQCARARAGKRGGGKPLLSLDLAAAEQRFDLEPADERSPDKLFDRQWATALLEEVLGRLAAEYRTDGKETLFTTLKATLAGSRESHPYAQLAVQLEMNEGAVRTAVHRLRKRYRELLRNEIAGTVHADADVNDEIRYLLLISGTA